MELAISGSERCLVHGFPTKVPPMPAPVSSEVDRHWPPVKCPSSCLLCQVLHLWLTGQGFLGLGVTFLAFRGVSWVR